jgi:hypothetical protein
MLRVTEHLAGIAQYSNPVGYGSDPPIKIT